MGSMTIVVPNATGLVLGAGYSLYYQYYSSGPSRELLLQRYWVGAGVLGGTVGLATLKWGQIIDSVGGVPVEQVLGASAALFSIVLMSSPLATMRKVVETQDSSIMNANMSAVIFANATSWTLYGWLVAADPVVWVPNALGSASALVQLALLHRFRKKARANDGKLAH